MYVRNGANYNKQLGKLRSVRAEKEKVGNRVTMAENDSTPEDPILDPEHDNKQFVALKYVLS